MFTYPDCKANSSSFFVDSPKTPYLLKRQMELCNTLEWENVFKYPVPASDHDWDCLYKLGNLQLSSVTRVRQGENIQNNDLCHPYCTS